MHSYIVVKQGRDDRALYFTLRKQAKCTHKETVARVVFTRKVMICCAVRVRVRFVLVRETASDHMVLILLPVCARAQYTVTTIIMLFKTPYNNC